MTSTAATCAPRLLCAEAASVRSCWRECCCSVAPGDTPGQSICDRSSCSAPHSVRGPSARAARAASSGSGHGCARAGCCLPPVRQHPGSVLCVLCAGSQLGHRSRPPGSPLSAITARRGAGSCCCAGATCKRPGMRHHLLMYSYVFVLYVPKGAPMREHRKLTARFLILSRRRRSRLRFCLVEDWLSRGRRPRWVVWWAAGSARTRGGRPPQLWVRLRTPRLCL